MSVNALLVRLLALEEGDGVHVVGNVGHGAVDADAGEDKGILEGGAMSVS